MDLALRKSQREGKRLVEKGWRFDLREGFGWGFIDPETGAIYHKAEALSIQAERDHMANLQMKRPELFDSWRVPGRY